MNPIIECVPNFSLGRNHDAIKLLVRAVEGVRGVCLLDQHQDSDHNRCVLTFAGSPEAVSEAAFETVRMATEAIDLNYHTGLHPYIGAADVVPFVPIQRVEMSDCVAIAKEVGARISSELTVPVFLYERACPYPARAALETIRKGGLESLANRMTTDPLWRPDFGPPCPHPTAGVAAVGARPILIAFNVNLKTIDVGVAQAIAKKIRTSGGGLPSLKALGIALKRRELVQVSMNLTNFDETSIDIAFEAVRREAEYRGVSIDSSELVGLVPEAALAKAELNHVLLKEFHSDQVLETRLKEVQVI